MHSPEHGIEVDFPTHELLVNITRTLPQQAYVNGGYIDFIALGIAPWNPLAPNDEGRYIWGCKESCVMPFSTFVAKYDPSTHQFLPSTESIGNNAWFIDDKTRGKLSPNSIKEVARSYARGGRYHIYRVSLGSYFDPRDRTAHQAAELLAQEHLDFLQNSGYQLYQGSVDILGDSSLRCQTDANINFKMFIPGTDNRGCLQLKRYITLNGEKYVSLAAWMIEAARAYNLKPRGMEIRSNFIRE